MNGVSLSLAELEAFDPSAPGADRRERRFCCPLPGVCSGKSINAAHRSLSLNTSTGKWHCNRCDQGGLIVEKREPWTPKARLARARESWQRHRPMETARKAAESPSDAGGTQKAAADTGEDAQKAAEWRANLARLEPLAGTPGAAYLESRGVPLHIAEGAKVLYSPSWYGRPAVVFGVKSPKGATVAAQGRYIDGRDDPKARTARPVKPGAFWTPGARDAKEIAICEGPINALTLALVGIPSVALCGTVWRSWMNAFTGWRGVMIAFDYDKNGKGDDAYEEWRAGLNMGQRVQRLKPETANDWNDVLQRGGVEAVRAEIEAAKSLQKLTDSSVPSAVAFPCIDCGKIGAPWEGATCKACDIWA